MRSLKSSGKPKKPKLLFIRKVIGNSMVPSLRPGQLVVASSLVGNLKSEAVVIFEHDNMEKIKRVSEIRRNKVFVIGDNNRSSIDSRSFGWLSTDRIIGKIIWPRL